VDLDLDSLKADLLDYIAAEGFALFQTQAGSLEGLPMIFWDTDAHPEYKAFLAVAKTAGARIVIFGQRKFEAEEIDDALEQMKDCEFGREERRSMERSLAGLRPFVGATCTLEMAFDYQGRLYVFELVTDWFQTFADLSDLLLTASSADEDEEEDDDESDSSFGGYYSKN
jgi:hypothetical protein